MNRITDYSVNRVRAYAKAGVDIIKLDDDVGMQEAIMMCEDMYTEWLKPRLARVIAAAKEAKPDGNCLSFLRLR